MYAHLMRQKFNICITRQNFRAPETQCAKFAHLSMAYKFCIYKLWNWPINARVDQGYMFSSLNFRHLVSIAVIHVAKMWLWNNCYQKYAKLLLHSAYANSTRWWCYAKI